MRMSSWKVLALSSLAIPAVGLCSCPSAHVRRRRVPIFAKISPVITVRNAVIRPAVTFAHLRFPYFVTSADFEFVDIDRHLERRILGDRRLDRFAVGDGYAQTLRATWPAPNITSTVTVREGIGTGLGRSQQAEVAHEMAVKAAETDATKRALATFGNPFGLALYDRDQTHVTKPRDRAPPPALPAAPKTF